MPIYEYRCHQCGERVEVLVHSGAEAPACPHCGIVLQERLLSTPYIRPSSRARPQGRTCCGQEERCERPPCSQGGPCQR